MEFFENDKLVTFYNEYKYPKLTGELAQELNLSKAYIYKVKYGVFNNPDVLELLIHKLEIKKAKIDKIKALSENL